MTECLVLFWQYIYWHCIQYLDATCTHFVPNYQMYGTFLTIYWHYTQYLDTTCTHLVPKLPDVWYFYNNILTSHTLSAYYTYKLCPKTTRCPVLFLTIHWHYSLYLDTTFTHFVLKLPDVWYFSDNILTLNNLPQIYWTYGTSLKVYILDFFVEKVQDSWWF